jgi:chaperone modulatory protein CbpM
MTKQMMSLLSGDVLEDNMEITLAELCRICRVPAERVFDLVEEGIAEPLGQDPRHWRFQGISVLRVRCALRLENDLGINAAGAALALDLLDEIESMRTRLIRLENLG